MVYMAGILSSLNMAILAVASFDFWLPNLERLYTKKGQIFDITNGNSLVSSGDPDTLQPYIKMFFRRECP